jgi:hypothetical protein
MQVEAKAARQGRPGQGLQEGVVMEDNFPGRTVLGFVGPGDGGDAGNCHDRGGAGVHGEAQGGCVIVDSSRQSEAFLMASVASPVNGCRVVNRKEKINGAGRSCSISIEGGADVLEKNGLVSVHAPLS